MPAFAPVVTEFNRQFLPGQIEQFARKAQSFAPGQKLDAGLILDPGSPLHRSFSRWLDTLPPAIHEALRGVIHGALSATPPQQVTVAWAPGYDHEMTIWPAACGITILLKSRYPADRLSEEATATDAQT